MIYKLKRERNGSISEEILRINDDGSRSIIPNDPENRDRRAYDAWLAEGNEPEDADE